MREQVVQNTRKTLSIICVRLFPVLCFSSSPSLNLVEKPSFIRHITAQYSQAFSTGFSYQTPLLFATYTRNPHHLLLQPPIKNFKER